MGAIISFIGACHDIGKASPVFQVKIRNEDRLNLLSRIENSSLKLRDDLKKSELSHSIISELIMERNGIDTSVSIVIGGHHGTQPTEGQLHNARSFPNHSGFNDVDW